MIDLASDLYGNAASAPLDVRNNNPGNMRSSEGGFQTFDTPKAGLDAMQKDLMVKVSGNSPMMKAHYGEGYSPTLRNVISTWAPPSENNTDNYIDFVAQHAGINPDQPLTSDDIPKIMQPMVHMEGGKKASEYFGKLMTTLPEKKYADSGNIATDAQIDAPPNVDLASELYGGNPVKDDIAQGLKGALSKIGESPLGQMIGSGIQSAQDAMGNITGMVSGTPYKEGASTPDLDTLRQKGWSGTTTPEKVGAVEEALFNSPTGKLLGTVAATPVGAAVGMGLSKVNQAAENNLGVPHQYSTALESLAPFLLKAKPDTTSALKQLSLEAPTIDNPPNTPPAVPPTVRPLPEGLGKTDMGDSISFSPEAAKSAQEILKTALQEEGIKPEQIAANLEKAQPTGLPLSALDVANKNVGGVQVQGNGLLKLAKATANMPGQAMSIAGDTAARGYISAQRIGDAFDKSISKAPYYGVEGDAIQSMEGSGKHYDTAFTANKDVSSPAINRILKTDAGKQALGYAADRMNAKMSLMGVPDPELAQQAALAGQYAGGGISSGLKLQTLDYVKRGLDEQAQKAYQGGDKGLASDITAQKKALVNELDKLDVTANKNASGAYAQARQTYSTGARVRDALEQGRDFMKMDAEEIASFFKDKDIPNPEKAAFAAGARRDLQDKIDNMRDTANPITSLWKPALRKRLEPMFPDKTSFDAFAQHMDHEATMHRTNARLMTGSDTAANSQLSEMVKQESPLARLIKGTIDPTGTAMSIGMDAMTKQMQKATSKMSKETAAVLMRYLTSKDPALWHDLADRINNPKNGIIYKEPKLSKGNKP